MVQKRDIWTEEEILELPEGESDAFDRKSGDLLASANWQEPLAKIVCAFANSGGGVVVLGVEDDGRVGGAQKIRKGSETTRDWLEKVVPTLLEYPLDNFRVHEVQAARVSQIPPGRVVIVIEVGDSALAPHQTSKSKTYYYRAAGTSVPAPHFYLETLRNRLTAASLSPRLDRVKFSSVARGVSADPRLMLEFDFRVENTGRVAAHQWRLVWECCGRYPRREQDYLDANGERLALAEGTWGYTGYKPILPSLFHEVRLTFGLQLEMVHDRSDVLRELSGLLQDWVFRVRAVSELSRGEPVELSVAAAANIERLTDEVWQALSGERPSAANRYRMT